MKNLEDRLSIALMDYVRIQYPQHRENFIHMPNGGNRSAATGALLKRMGVLPGVSDYICTQPSSGWPLLWIELKTETGKVTDTQKEFLAAQRQNGAMAVVAFGWDEAKYGIDRWMDGRPWAMEWMATIPKRERKALKPDVAELRDKSKRV